MAYSNRLSGLTPSVSDLVSLGWSLVICISHRLPDVDVAIYLGATL